MSFDGFAGTRMGAVQTTYRDQPGVALAGQLAFASDINKCDSIFIGETEGIAAGRGVRMLSGNDGLNFQNPPELAYLPEGDEAVAEFGGIVVFEQTMRSSSTGVNGWNKYDVAKILRPGVGGRIWVPVKDSIVPGTSTVNWVIIVDQAGKYELGEFCPTALATGAAGTSVALTNCKWITRVTTSGLAMMEIFGTTINILSTDAS